MPLVLAQTGPRDITDGAEGVFEFDLQRYNEAFEKCDCIVQIADTPSGTLPTLNFAVKWSADKVTWYDGTETALTEQTAAGGKSDALTVEGRYLQLTPTIGGTPADPTLTVTETQAGVDGVQSEGTLSLPTIPTGAVKAEGTLTVDTQPVAGDTMTIDEKVYTFVDGPTIPPGDGNIAIGANLAATQINIVAAINGSGSGGTEYGTGTVAHPTVVAATFATNASVITARAPGTAGNSIATTETFTAGTNVFDDTTLGTTTLGVAGDTMTVDTKVYTFVAVGDLEVGADGQISIGANVAATQANIVAAFDLSGTAGTDYSTGMTAHPTVTIAAFAANDAVLTAVAAGAAGDTIATTETFTPVGDIFDGVTLGTTTAGVDAVSEITTIDRGVADSGDWDLTVGANTASAIPWNVDAATLKTTIEALASVTGAVTVVGSGVPTTDPWVITFSSDDGALAVSSGADALTELDLFTGVTIQIIA